MTERRNPAAVYRRRSLPAVSFRGLSLLRTAIVSAIRSGLSPLARQPSATSSCLQVQSHRNVAQPFRRRCPHSCGHSFGRLRSMPPQEWGCGTLRARHARQAAFSRNPNPAALSRWSSMDPRIITEHLRENRHSPSGVILQPTTPTQLPSRVIRPECIKSCQTFVRQRRAFYR